MAPLGVLDEKRDEFHHWGLQACFGKARIRGILLLLMVLFLITISYVLTGEKSMLLLTTSPSQIRTGVCPGQCPSNFTAANDYTNMKLVVKAIVSKVEFSSRHVPNLKDLIQQEPHMLSIMNREFLPNIKNPCWYEPQVENALVNPYEKNVYALRSARVRKVTEDLRKTFQEHLFYHRGRYYRLRCLPYFYIIGQAKCGTTDLYNRLQNHPDVRFPPMKEPHWWTRKRFGIGPLSVGLGDSPVEDYLDLFDMTAFQIQDNLAAITPGKQYTINIIAGDASASTLWDNKGGFYYYNSISSDREPPFLIQDFIHAIQPEVKLIVILRDPGERLYSDYLYFGEFNKSAEDFHEQVSESLQLFEGCLAQSSLRSCVYNITLRQAMSVRLQLGVYIVYILDWLSLFRRDQILVLRLEDHATNPSETMRTVFDFLSLGPLGEQEVAATVQRPASNTRSSDNQKLGPMLPVTKEILRDFHSPFNEKLAKVLNNDSFLWHNHEKHT